MNQDFLDILLALSEAKARFLLVGAFAVSVHAEPRATGDMDIWVEPTRSNARKVYQALKVFGAPLHELTETDLASKNIVFQMGIVPNRIDIITSISGVQFDKAWPNRVKVDLKKVVVPVIGRKDLLKNKRATGRPKDLLDLELLKKSNKS